MKIAYVITRSDAVGGASIHVRDLARAMQEAGHQVLVFVGGTGPVTDQLDAAGVPYRPLQFLGRRIHPQRDRRALSELTAALAGMHPDIVSTHTAKTGWIGRAAAARLGLPVIYTPHGLTVGSRLSPLLGPLFTIAERIASRWTRQMICVCEYERRLAIEKKLIPVNRITVIHNGIRDIPPEQHADPGRDPVRICSVARFQAPKDHATLIRALGNLQSQPWELDLVGDGPLEPEIRRLAAALGISERVHFLGYQQDPATVLANAQVFALSSRSEAFPRSILEAMRAGLPVVASDVGGVSEAVVPDSTGLLVPPGAFDANFRLERMVQQTAAVYATVAVRAI